MRPTYFRFFLFQLNADYPAAITTISALAAFSQREDAAVLAKKLRKLYAGLNFPVYKLEDFDEAGNLLEWAEECEVV